MNNIKSVAIFCGSKLGNNPAFNEDAVKLATQLALQKIDIIYGGGGVGIMGNIANAALENNGIVKGIIPKVLVEWEQQHKGITQLYITNNMHDRKQMIYTLCDAAIILPGGYGTLDELFETITWNNLKIHQKKVFLLNTSGFYNHLLNHIKLMQNEGFLYNDWQENISVCETPEILINHLN